KDNTKALLKYEQKRYAELSIKFSELHDTMDKVQAALSGYSAWNKSAMEIIETIAKIKTEALRSTSIREGKVEVLERENARLWEMMAVAMKDPRIQPREKHEGVLGATGLRNHLN